MALTPVPTIDPGLGNVPDPADDEVIFEADAYDFTSRMPGFGADIKAIGDATYANAQWAETKAGEAATSASNANTSATNAAASEDNAAQSALDAEASVAKFQGELASDPALNKTGGALTAGDWYVNTTTGLIRAYNGSAFVNSIGVTAGVDNINGLTGAVLSPSQAEAEAGTESTKPMTAQRTSQAIAALAKAKVIRSARSSNTALAAADFGKWIDITSGTFTQTFAAAAALADGWWCYLGNSGTGDITLDPNSTETIDGLTSYVMYPGEVRLVMCDGSALRSIVVNAFYRTFTTSETFTKPPGYAQFNGLLWGSGGSGGKGSTSPAYYGGGGGGACNPFSLKSTAVPSSVTVTISSATAAPIVANTVGNTGGTSSFGTLAYAYGGAGGQNGNGGGGGGVTSAGSGANGGGPRGGSAAASPGSAFSGAYTGIGSDYGGAGGAGNGSPGPASIYGGAGGGGSTVSGGALAGGTSVYGGNGGAGSVGASGDAASGTAPGGGGGGAAGGVPGNGARGECRIWGVI